MIYGRSSETGRTRIYRPLSGRRPTPEGIEPSDADREAVLRVARDQPRWAAQEIYSGLRLAGRDIPLEVVEMVLARPQPRTPPGRAARLT